MLLSHWTGGPAWSMPGGGMELGEQATETVIREVFEETGYDVEVQQILGVDTYVIPAERRFAEGLDTPLQGVRIVYRARITGGELTFERDGSSDRAEWFALDDLPQARVSLVDIALRLADLKS